jgi:hypothetical protein
VRTKTIAENTIWWESLMNLLFNCPGMYMGKNFDGMYSGEEREILAELWECNNEYLILRRERGDD